MFTLSENFLSSYKSKQPKWGFNNLGYLVFKRTYARQLENGQTEEWIHTCPAGVYKTDTLVSLVWTIFTHRLHHFLKGEGFTD